MLAGIDEQGLYRIAGVNSRVQKLLNLAMGAQKYYDYEKFKCIFVFRIFVFNFMAFSIRSKDLCWRGAGKPRVGDQDHYKCYQALSEVWLKRK